MAWRDELRPASFRGVPFHVEANSRTGGRRGITFEFPKRDDPLDEDMGGRARRIMVSGYVIGPFYNDDADALEFALNQEGGGLLVLPTMGQQIMRCDPYTRTEIKREGGMAVFEMGFAPAGEPSFPLFTEATQQAVRNSAATAGTAVLGASKP